MKNVKIAGTVFLVSVIGIVAANASTSHSMRYVDQAHMTGAHRVEFSLGRHHVPPIVSQTPTGQASPDHRHVWPPIA